MTPTRWPAQAVLAGLALVVAVTAIALAVAPQALRTPDAILIPPAVAVLGAVYALIGVAALRRPAPGDRLGAVLGFIAGAMWSVEIFGGGPAMLSKPVEVAIGATFALAAVGFSLAAGPAAAIRHRTAAAAFRAGAFAGLVSGLVTYLFGTVMTLSILDLLGSRGDYQAQLAHSGAPGMDAFLVQDALAGMTAHLAINLVLGLTGAGLATAVMLVIRAIRPRETRNTGRYSP